MTTAADAVHLSVSEEFAPVAPSRQRHFRQNLPPGLREWAGDVNGPVATVGLFLAAFGVLAVPPSDVKDTAGALGARDVVRYGGHVGTASHAHVLHVIDPHRRGPQRNDERVALGKVREQCLVVPPEVVEPRFHPADGRLLHWFLEVILVDGDVFVFPPVPIVILFDLKEFPPVEQYPVVGKPLDHRFGRDLSSVVREDDCIADARQETKSVFASRSAAFLCLSHLKPARSEGIMEGLVGVDSVSVHLNRERDEAHSGDEARNHGKLDISGCRKIPPSCPWSLRGGDHCHLLAQP